MTDYDAPVDQRSKCFHVALSARACAENTHWVCLVVYESPNVNYKSACKESSKYVQHKYDHIGVVACGTVSR